MPAGAFERDIVHAFNDYFMRDDIKGLSYRHYQLRFLPQVFDVMIDSPDPRLYLAMECKSIDSNDVNMVYFKKHFSSQKGVHQVERESNYLDLTGRRGFLVVELRTDKPKKTMCYFVPWSLVRREYSLGRPGVYYSDISLSPSLVKRSGKYIIDDEFIEELLTYRSMKDETIP